MFHMNYTDHTYACNCNRTLAGSDSGGGGVLETIERCARWVRAAFR